MNVWSRVGGRTRKVLAAGLRALSPPLTAGYYAELEELLIAADMGPVMAARLAAAVRDRSPRTREELSTRPRGSTGRPDQYARLAVLSVPVPLMTAMSFGWRACV